VKEVVESVAGEEFPVAEPKKCKDKEEDKKDELRQAPVAIMRVKHYGCLGNVSGGDRRLERPINSTIYPTSNHG